MKIKWYWLAEQMGLVSNLTAQYNDGAIHYQVSARADEVFSILFLSLIPLLFLFGLILRFLLCRAGHPNAGRQSEILPPKYEHCLKYVLRPPDFSNSA